MQGLKNEMCILDWEKRHNELQYLLNYERD